MKIIYTNLPCNKKRASKGISVKTLAVLGLIIVGMVAVRFIYLPDTSNAKEAAAIITENDTSKSTAEPKKSEAIPAGITTVNTISGQVIPLKGEITSYFGSRPDPFNESDLDYHRGVDIAPSDGLEICAYRDGTVEKAGFDRSYGNFVLINHGDGFESLYAHCSELYVENSENVKAGQIIALAGETGNATGVHLHFEIRLGGACVDPLDFAVWQN